jgi:hypothetical protein
MAQSLQFAEKTRTSRWGQPQGVGKIAGYGVAAG